MVHEYAVHVSSLIKFLYIEWKSKSLHVEG
jgi:hypothetical protein